MSIFISKETINRLLHDVKQIHKNPLCDQGIYYFHDDTDMLKGYAMIVGPSDTCYFGGFYFFELNYPNDYPHSPPKVKFCTNENNIRFNPNLYTCGKVCISLLNTWRGDQWTSCQTISSVLLTLCTLFCENPLLNEPGITKLHKDIKNYNEIIHISNINIAICNIIKKGKNFYLPFFDHFSIYIKENFNKNYEKIKQNIKEKINSKDYDVNFILKTNIYQMNVLINYDEVLKKLNECKKICEN